MGAEPQGEATNRVETGEPVGSAMSDGAGERPVIASAASKVTMGLTGQGGEAASSVEGEDADERRETPAPAPGERTRAAGAAGVANEEQTAKPLAKASEHA